MVGANNRGDASGIMRLLLIEDDEDTGSAVVEALRARGHAVDWEDDGKSGLDRAVSGAHALLIVDRMLPEMDGLSVVTELRRRQVVAPVLMLTAGDGPWGEASSRARTTCTHPPRTHSRPPAPAFTQLGDARSTCC